MARQAYNFASAHGGNAHGPEITNALRVALESFDDREARVFVGHSDAVRTLALATDGRLITGSDDGRIRSFAAEDPARPATMIEDLRSPVRSMAFDRHGGLLAAGTFDGTLRVWSYSPWKLVKAWTAHAAAVSGVAFDASGRLVSVGFDGRLKTWEPGTFAPEASVPGSEAKNRLLAVTVSPDGDRVAAAVADEGVLLWEFPHRLTTPIALGRNARVSSLTFSPDGRRLAAGTTTGELRLWNITDPLRSESVLPAHRGSITALRFDGSMLASGSLDGDLKVWDSSGNVLREQPLVLTHGAWIWAVTTGAEKGRVFSAGADGRVRAWATSAAALAEESCRRVARNLTEAEWRAHVSALVPYAISCPDVVDRKGHVQLP
jgi:WD40 repeat protein